MTRISEESSEPGKTGRTRLGGGIFALGIGLLLAGNGVLIALEPVFGGANTNGIAWGAMNGGLILLVGAGLSLFGFGLVRSGPLSHPGRETGSRSWMLGGLVLAVLGIAAFAALIGLLVLVAEGIRQST